LICRKGYLAVFINDSYELRLFAVKRINEFAKITFFCYLCKRKTCTHIKEDILDDDGRLDAYINQIEFNYDNDFEDRPDVLLDDIVSFSSYPCKKKIDFLTTHYFSQDFRLREPP
jgi:hypothetical protein